MKPFLLKLQWSQRIREGGLKRLYYKEIIQTLIKQDFLVSKDFMQQLLQNLNWFYCEDKNRQKYVPVFIQTWILRFRKCFIEIKNWKWHVLYTCRNVICYLHPLPNRLPFDSTERCKHCVVCMGVCHFMTPVFNCMPERLKPPVTGRCSPSGRKGFASQTKFTQDPD